MISRTTHREEPLEEAQSLEELPSLVRLLRERAGLTQEELAFNSGLSIRTISDLERGRTTAPQRRSIELLADALCVEGDSLEQFRRTARGRSVAQCPSCSARWQLDELTAQRRSA
ncbi:MULTISPECIES: helix-turn-helix domain-containing protein [Streptomyces]|uniref:Transcriptional regulator with XRE-family HTH domain n=1 Tax=Streptomyces nymphaeiformis TaxID=2663842 RepID=A0A7W7U3P8_9ACTN|nr:helix-turn-helix transcriptional regulator [Streptomyces nymphaeiformis]MBB4982965.1 transcriptional regulator with XRE-family HTH domain [Streptomyces nymphaeiformis]